MRYRALGPSGIKASVVGLGTWVVGGWMWGGCEERDAIAGIRTALDAGVNLVDTAPVYGFGQSEELVGKAIAGRRDDVVLATKCGLVWHVEKGDFFFDTRASHALGWETPHVVHKYLGRESIRYEVEQSLRRLKTDVIDLYQTHWQESTTPREETMAALLELKDEGKIRAIGVSNATPEQMAEYRAVGQLDSDQESYSMLDRKADTQQLPYCLDQGLAFLAYSPLARGLLTGKMGPEREFEEGDQRRDSPRFSVENRRRVAALLDEFSPIAEGHEASVLQVVIAWTVAQPGCSHALVGARNPTQARENAKAGEIELTADELEAMNNAIARHAHEIE